MLSGHTRLFGIVGDPIAKVRAPHVWTRLFERFGIDAVMIPFAVTAGDLDLVMAGLKRLENLDGLILTMPHKVTGVRHVDELAEQGARTGAINVMRRDGDRWIGDMLDGLGFVAGLRHAGVALEGESAFLAGSGGVGTAIGMALLAAGISRLSVFDRDRARASALVERGRTHHPRGVEIEFGEDAPREHDLIVNATPMGMQPTDPLPFDLDRAQNSAVVAEVVMDPITTPLLAAARARGQRVHDGRHMLDCQIGIMADLFGLPACDWAQAAAINREDGK